MEFEIQNHITHIGKFTVKGGENVCLLDKTCTMLSELLPPLGRLASKMSSSSSSVEEKIKSIQIGDVSHSSEIDTNISIELITEEDTEEVLKLLKKFFFKDEPLNTFVNLGECKELEKYSTKCLHEHYSFKAVNSHGEIVGVIINGVINKPTEADGRQQKLADGCAHPKFKKIMALMDYVDDHFNIFDLYQNVDRMLDIKIMSVDNRYRGLGIAGKLTDRTMQCVRENNINLVHVLCSSHFSARVMEKIGFEEVYKLSYRDYLVNGEQVFKPDEPHNEVRILVKNFT